MGSQTYFYFFWINFILKGSLASCNSVGGFSSGGVSVGNSPSGGVSTEDVSLSLPPCKSAWLLVSELGPSAAGGIPNSKSCAIEVIAYSSSYKFLKSYFLPAILAT